MKDAKLLSMEDNDAEKNKRLKQLISFEGNHYNERGKEAGKSSREEEESNQEDLSLTQCLAISRIVWRTTPGTISPLRGGVINSRFPNSLMIKTKTEASFKLVISSSFE